MKLHLILPIFAIATSALADFNLPSSVFEMDELPQAKAKAAEEGKPLIIVHTTSETS